MNSFENQSPQPEVNRPKLTKEDVLARLEQNKNLENFDLKNLDLAGLNLEGKSFRGSDIRGLKLYREDDNEVTTNINNTDWTDCVVADLGREAYFPVVEAENATFGFSETLASRRQRWHDKPPAEDCGGYFNFNGSSGNFKGSRWQNINFGGGTGYEALFNGAILGGALFEGCDLKYIDFSESLITGIKINIAGASDILGLKIKADQIPDLINALDLADLPNKQSFDKLATTNPAEALKKFFGVEII